jgi:hypothetical protein
MFFEKKFKFKVLILNIVKRKVELFEQEEETETEQWTSAQI